MGKGTIIIHEHTRVGTGFNCAALVAAHCPALQTGVVLYETFHRLKPATCQGLSALRTTSPPSKAFVTTPTCTPTPTFVQYSGVHDISACAYLYSLRVEGSACTPVGDQGGGAGSDPEKDFEMPHTLPTVHPSSGGPKSQAKRDT